jgi:GTP-binding protein
MRISSAEFIKSATNPSQYPKSSLPEIAFAGRSNVGKSSLINVLVRRKKLAKTSSTPGRTQLINFFEINEKISLVDLPGYGYARVPHEIKKKWKPMVESYLSERENLRLVVVIFDIRRRPSEDELSMVRWIEERGVSALIVLTKIDKISKNSVAKQKKAFEDLFPEKKENYVTFSAVTREGNEAIWEKVLENISPSA